MVQECLRRSIDTNWKIRGPWSQVRSKGWWPPYSKVSTVGAQCAVCDYDWLVPILISHNKCNHEYIRGEVVYGLLYEQINKFFNSL